MVGALSASGLPPDRLELEITEGMLLQDCEATLNTLYKLRALGVRIAMDDFGTGYSSLSYLQSFPFDKIKIDRSFVKDIADGVGSLNIVRAVAAMANGLGMTTTAEGVETKEQLDTVRAEGCTEMQGFLFSKPLPADEIEPLLLASVQCRLGSCAPTTPPERQQGRRPAEASGGEVRAVLVSVGLRRAAYQAGKTAPDRLDPGDRRVGRVLALVNAPPAPLARRLAMRHRHRSCPAGPWREAPSRRPSPSARGGARARP